MNTRLKVGIHLLDCAFMLILAWFRAKLKSRANLWLVMLYCSSFHACMCVLMNFELISWQIVTCMFIIKLKSMVPTCFEKNELIRACFGSFEKVWIHACLHVLHVHENGFEIWIYLIHPWALNSQIKLWNLLYIE